MRMSTIALGTLVSSAILGTAGVQAADTVLTFGGAPGQVTWSKTSGPTGRLFAGGTYGGSTTTDVTGPGPAIQSGVSWTFSADFVTGSAQTLAPGIKSASFQNGVFSFAGSNGLILAGTFSSGMLVSNFGALTFSVGGNGIAYTGGSALPTGSSQTGDMAIGISGHGLPSGWTTNTSGNIVDAGFTGEASGTFDTSSGVPEPSEWAAMGILGTATAGLMVRARRRS